MLTVTLPYHSDTESEREQNGDEEHKLSSQKPQQASQAAALGEKKKNLDLRCVY